MKTIVLSDICEISSGGTTSRSILSYYKGEIPWAKISDIEKAESTPHQYQRWKKRPQRLASRSDLRQFLRTLLAVSPVAFRGAGLLVA